MANEKRLIDPKKALYLAEHSGLYDFDLSALETLLCDEPCLTVDAVPVVRCKDCMWCGDFDVNGIGLCLENNKYVLGDDFCSDGERREGE